MFSGFTRKHLQVPKIRTSEKLEVGLPSYSAHQSTDLYGIGFECTDDENDEALVTLRRRAWAALRAKVDEQTADTAILTKSRTYFEERFRYDEQGLPRVWKPDDDIDGAFKKAKDLTLDLISLYAKIEPEDPELEYTPPEDGEDDTPGWLFSPIRRRLNLVRGSDARSMRTTSRRNGARSWASHRSRIGSTG